MKRRNQIIKHTGIGLCLLAGLFAACDLGVGDGSGFSLAIHRLADSSLTASAVWRQPLDDLQLADSALLTIQDFTRYEWETHTFTVIPRAQVKLDVLRTTLGPTGGIPFVVTVDGERVYLGAFWYPHSSLMPRVPHIDMMLPVGPLGSAFQISRGINDAFGDPRADARIRSALERAGVLVP